MVNPRVQLSDGLISILVDSLLSAPELVVLVQVVKRLKSVLIGRVLVSVAYSEVEDDVLPVAAKLVPGSPDAIPVPDNPGSIPVPAKPGEIPVPGKPGVRGAYNMVGDDVDVTGSVIFIWV